MAAVKLSKHLIQYERDGALLLLNGATIKPILIRQGKDRVLDTLKSIDSPKDERLVDFLVAHDIVVDDDDTEDYRVPDSDASCKRCNPRTDGLSLYLLLSQNCNMRCVYCLNGEKTYRRGRSRQMTENVALAGIDKMARTITPGGDLEIVFFGGEPLLNWGLAKKVILYCENVVAKKLPGLKIRYNLTSNLTMFPTDLIAWAKEYRLGFLCNIDGNRALHDQTRPMKDGSGSHDRTARNISRLTRAGLSVSLRATVTARNMNELREVSRHHKELGGTGSAFVTVNAVNSDENILENSLLPDPHVVAEGLRDVAKSGLWNTTQLYPLNEFIKRIKPGQRNVWGCGAPFGNTPVLDVAGDVYACIYLVGIRRYKLGNVFSSAGYPDVDVVFSMQNAINIDNSQECRPCRLRYLCGGGCPVGRLTILGNPKSDEAVKTYTREIACTVNKAMVEESLWHYAEHHRMAGSE